MSWFYVKIGTFFLSMQDISQFLLIIVGASAILVYEWQEKGKIRNAASLCVLQIDEMQERMREIQSFISNNKQLNATAFYESLPIMEVNYWDKYKHLLIRKVDSKSCSNFDKFYQYISCVREQQQLIRNLQRNFFFLQQSEIVRCEFLYINETNGAFVVNNPVSYGANISSIQMYNNKTQHLFDFVNKNMITLYIPEQIAMTLEAVFRQYALLEITGTEGYRKLRKLAKI